MNAKTNVLWSALMSIMAIFMLQSAYAQPYILDEAAALVYPQAQHPPEIDGVMDSIWTNTPRYPMAHVATGYPSEPAGWYDMSGEWRAMWDHEYMYFFVDIRDNILNAGPDYNWDSIEFYSDADYSHGQDYDGLNDFQFRIHYNDDNRSVTLWTNEKGPIFETVNIIWAQQETENGWTAEIAAPMSDLLIDPEPGLLVGTDMEYNDNDEGAVCDHKIIAFGDVELSWSDPSYMGEAVLSGWMASNALRVVKAPAAPLIDGEFDDAWKNVPVIPAGNYMSWNKIDDFDDLSVTTQVMWDPNYLYAFVRVWDDTLVRDGSGDSDDDGIELYFDGDYSHGTAYDGKNDMQIGFVYQTSGDPLAPAKQVGSTSGFDLSGVVQASKKTADGVVLEAAFPMSLVQIPAVEGSVFGIEMDYNDDDDDGVRDTKLKTYSKTDDTWQNPSLMAPAELVGASAVAVRERVGKTPAAYQLAQNYPNPFNPSTTIAYVLDRPGQVNLAVFDMLGREMKTLVNGIQPKGKYTARFDGSDMPGGMYLVRLQTADRTLIRKMMLAK